jgi:hypothetical protein
MLVGEGETLAVEKIGSTATDLSGYAKLTDLPGEDDFGVLEVTGKDAIDVTYAEADTAKQHPVVELVLDNSGNVTLSQSETGLKAEVDLSGYLTEDDLPDFPDIAIEEMKPITGASSNTAFVVATIVSSEHTITPSSVEVVTPKGLEEAINGIVIPEIPDITVAAAKALEPVPTEYTTTVLAMIEADDHTITPTTVSVATAALVGTGARLINQEEINKLAQLTLEEGGGVAISGTINAQNVHGLGKEVQDIVTGLGEYISTPAIGKEGEEGYVPAVTIRKLGIQEGAEVNKIVGITLGTKDPAAITIPDTRIVNIPTATLTTLGLVKSSEADNQIKVDEDGKMEVNALTTDKIKNGTEEFILNGGNASLNK